MDLIDIDGNQYNLDDIKAPVEQAGAILYDGRDPNQFHIDYIDDKDKRHIVKGYPLHHMFISHSKVLIHLFIEHMRSGGAPVYQIIGVVTLKIDPADVQDMVEVGSYPLGGEHGELSPDAKQYIWINKEDKDKVRIYIPKSFKVQDYVAVPPKWNVEDVITPKKPNIFKRRDKRYQ